MVWLNVCSDTVEWIEQFGSGGSGFEEICLGLDERSKRGENTNYRNKDTRMD